MSISVPKLKDDPLYTIDGQFLMESTYRKEYLKREYGIDVEDNKMQEIKNFLRENKIKPPVYYVILAMDGDEMGKWLNGEKMPKVKELLHQNSINALKNNWEENRKDDLKDILESPHPMSPSFHNNFSRRISDFALNKIRKIVEEDFYGKLIYAGGDDVLAFLPVEDVIPCAYELQKSFKESLCNKASMSAGIVFVHHKYPLQLALNKVREAEKYAKNIYCRNACCLQLVRNSGELRTTGFKWDKENNLSLLSQKEFFDKIIDMYKNEKISSKFVYDFMTIVNDLKADEDTNEVNIKNIIKKKN